MASTTTSSSLRGGFSSIRHNEIRDITAELLPELCYGVCAEPCLQPMTCNHKVFSYRTANKEDGARLDIVAEEIKRMKFPFSSILLIRITVI